MRYLILGFILFCSISLFADTVITYTLLPGNETVNKTTTTIAVETLNLEQMLFRKRSLEADIDSLTNSKNSYLDSYNSTVADKEADKDNLLSIIANMTIPKE